MLNFQNYIVNKLMKHTFQNDDEVYLFMMSYVATTFCLVIHVFLLCAFFVEGVTLFTFFNVISVTIYLLLWLVVIKKYYTIAGLVISIEVMAYTTVFCFLTGEETFTFGYFLLIIVMQVLVPYVTQKMRMVVVSAVLICLTFCITKDGVFSNTIFLDTSFSYMLYIVNIYIVFLGVIVELYVSNIVKIIIRQFNDIKISKLSEQANTDSLTKLYNRHYADYFFMKLQKEELEQNYCVAMIDIDDFKHINDTYGHDCGDEVLRFLADYLRNRLRKTDTIFRWGGEEFLVVLEGVNIETALFTMDKIRKGIANETILFEEQTLQITITVGIDVLNNADPYASIAASDEKMYRGKQNRKNQVVAYT